MPTKVGKRFTMIKLLIVILSAKFIFLNVFTTKLVNIALEVDCESFLSAQAQRKMETLKEKRKRSNEHKKRMQRYQSKSSFLPFIPDVYTSISGCQFVSD